MTRKARIIFFICGLPLLLRRAGGRIPLRGLENEFLNAPRGDFRDVELVRVAAVDLVHAAELLQVLPRLAEPADDRAVELHLVDLTGDVARRGRAAVGPGV